MKFLAQDIRELRFGGSVENMESVGENMSGHSRWSVEVEFIFKYGDKFYRADFSDPATEYQDSSPDLDTDKDDMVECDEVFPVEIKTIKYYTAKGLEKLAKG
jgi:hypothetical protein